MQGIKIPIAILASLQLALATGEFPVIDGVLGGIRNSSQSSTPPAVSVNRVAGSLRVTENTGVCETTEGVYSASGYGDLSADESVWYIKSLLRLHNRLTLDHAGSGSLNLEMIRRMPRSRFGLMVRAHFSPSEPLLMILQVVPDLHP